ncbi:MAG: RibD family protein, partial [Alphaproteobacteria bacterium]
PLVALKTAMTLDGRIAAASGDSKWITGPEARRQGHLLRARHDAILVGAGTARADDPRLDCRIPGLEAASPLRIVVDSRLGLDSGLDLVKGAKARPTWAFGREDAPADRRAALEAAGVRVFAAPADAGVRVDLAAVLGLLAAEGVTRLLVEGGAAVAAALLGQGLVDRIHAFRAPFALGADGLAAIGPLGLDRVSDAPRFIRREMSTADDDGVELYVRAGA